MTRSPEGGRARRQGGQGGATVRLPLLLIVGWWLEKKRKGPRGAVLDIIGGGRRAPTPLSCGKEKKREQRLAPLLSQDGEGGAGRATKEGSAVAGGPGSLPC